ncbi:hypothetical protein MMAN_04370 [Mycobacterium mantenii]|uniref:Uncharacterized protein n=1 Tax=Mycobacterium mantenii TaxID=560555 RepID=A0ABM7JLZ8_MYCNT|nr:hypothetical protein MMAN_04370 [Mycobacterium mantenii]
MAAPDPAERRARPRSNNTAKLPAHHRAPAPASLQARSVHGTPEGMGPWPPECPKGIAGLHSVSLSVQNATVCGYRHSVRPAN